MAHHNWERIKKLFSDALDVDSRRRETWLKEACGGDADIYDQVIKLLQARKQSSPVDKTLDDLLPARAFSADEMDKTDKKAGPYKLVEPIGHGGMGMVYKARREDGEFDQLVALKFLRFGLTNENLIRRFKTERQILASLQHPNIARLLDGGVMDDGTPWFSMEYVEGEPLVDYAGRNALTVRERLELFLKICRAVQHAHQGLIMHRDLKPSNILVTDIGRPMLLDFGLARFIEDEPNSPGACTRPTAHWMTLEYAAPEQVKGETLTTATDIYQLGLILHELLTGRRPYSVKGCSPGEAERIICETELSRPSTRTGTRDASLPDTKEFEPVRLKKILKGDLDTILLKTLQKDPSMRFSSAGQLAEDIERYLKGEPILSRPATIRYRAATFAKRHKKGIVAACLMVFLLTGLSAYHTNRIAHERDNAQNQAAKAENINNFMIGLFELADPSVNLGESLTAGEMLDRGVAQISRLAEEPEQQVEVLKVAGEIFTTLMELDKAEIVLEQALAAIEGLEAGADDLMTADIYNLLGSVYRQKNEFERAEEYNRKALAIQRRNGSARNGLICTLNNLGLIARQQGYYDTAKEYYQEAIGLGENQRGGPQNCSAMAINNIGTLYRETGDYELALKYHSNALELRRQLYGDGHPEVAASLNNKALSLHGLGRYEEAAATVEKALAINRAVLGDGHPLVARNLNTIANNLWAVEDFEEAARHLREALEIQVSHYGEGYTGAAITQLNLGIMLLESGEQAEAIHRIETAAAAFREGLGERHLHYAHALANLGSALQAAGDHGRAKEVLAESLEIRKEGLPAGHWHIGIVKSYLGESLAALGTRQQAEEYLQTGYDIIADHRREDDVMTAQALNRLERFLGGE